MGNYSVNQSASLRWKCTNSLRVFNSLAFEETLSTDTTTLKWPIRFLLLSMSLKGIATPLQIKLEMSNFHPGICKSNSLTATPSYKQKKTQAIPLTSPEHMHTSVQANATVLDSQTLFLFLLN